MAQLTPLPRPNATQLRTGLLHDLGKVRVPKEVLLKPGKLTEAERSEIQRHPAEGARILLDHFGRVTVLVGVLRTMPTATPGPSPEARRFIAKSHAAVLSALTDLLDRHSGRLTIEPARAAAALQGLLFARLQPMMAPAERLTIEEIVAILLNGIADPKAAT